ncbi:MAG TPA: acetylxylan esterase [Chthonomonadaceae bacterium]|nr:acetylxylan esterase [Chthonomonadaceae bacterium]
MMTIREYLAREAQRITDRAVKEYTDAATWERLLPERRRRFREMLGLQALPPYEQRPPLNVTVTGVVERPHYRIEKLYYESLPKLYVAGNLYVPNERHPQDAAAGEGRFPGVLYVCGHSPTQKVHYQAHARRFAELGFVCLIVDTVQYGEVRGYHHGCYHEGWFHWYSRGYTPAGIEALNGIRGLDLLAQRPEVDAHRLGVTGTSGGGAVSWWTTASDERERVTAPSCGTSTLHSHIADRTIDGHCDCMWWINTYRWDLADVGALIAPRPLLIASANRDAINAIAAIRQVYEQLKPLYAALGVSENLQLVEGPGPHAYTPNTRTAIFSWFARHLQGRDVPAEEVGDLDDAPERQESEETLRVYLNGPLPDDRTTTIQDDLFTPPQLPRIAAQEDVAWERERVIAALREKTFGAFPSEPPPLDVRREFEFAWHNATGCRFAFTSEEGWRLHGQFILPRTARTPAPALVALRSPGESRGATEAFLHGAPASWARVIVEPRGTGETAWGEELQWHLRRAAAWTGRTLASLRVWDTLRAIEAVRSLPEVDEGRIALAARGEMAAAALYAALLDGSIVTLILDSPPATQNAPSSPDGRGPALEMLNCLQITDLGQVAGLLYPTEILVLGDMPVSYAWAERLYHRLGEPGVFRHIGSLREWQEAQ